MEENVLEKVCISAVFSMDNMNLHYAEPKINFHMPANRSPSSCLSRSFLDYFFLCFSHFRTSYISYTSPMFPDLLISKGG
jgi:hypothetical protein